MRRILTLALAGVVTLAGCSDDEKSNARPVLSVATEGAVTESAVTWTATATDSDNGTLTCTFALVAQPRGSRITLAPGNGDCKATPLAASFTPMIEGDYVVRFTADDGEHSTPTSQDVTVNVASIYGGGTVSGTTTGTVSTGLTDTIAAVTALGALPTNQNVSAQNAFKAFANIPLTGTPPVQGDPLAWADRPYDVVDVRDAADFAAGHIPGAINVPLDELPAVMMGDPRFPGTEADMRRVLVTGYSQGDSALAANLITAGRRILGAIPDGTTPADVADQRIYWLAQGMAAWTFDKTVAPMRWDDDLNVRRFLWSPSDGQGYVVSSASDYAKAVPPLAERVFPNIGDFNAATADNMRRVLVRAREWLAWAKADAEANDLPASEAFVTNWGRWKDLRDASQTPQVLTTQNNTQWKVAHAAGAIPVAAADPISDPLVAGDLALYDPNGPVFVHCFTNTGAVPVGMRLGLLGFKARTILYGVTGALDPTAPGTTVGTTLATTTGYSATFVTGVEDKGAGGNDFPLASEANPGTPDSLAWATPSRSGCVECHRDYAAHFTEVTTTSTAPAPEPVSEGEG